MGLFQSGDFVLHSGGRARWKICCDELGDGDWAALAAMLAERLGYFGEVVGVPRGGLKLAGALGPYARGNWRRVLLVDDVLTTGRSMGEAAAGLRAAGSEVFGAVVFARGPCPPWVYPLFRMTPAPEPAG